MDPDPVSFLYSLDYEFLLEILVIIILLGCSAFISGSEVALFSLNQKDIDDISNIDFKKGSIISRLLEKPKKLLATILVTNNFVNIAVVILFSTISGRLFEDIKAPIMRFLLEVVLVTFFLLLIGEVIPKIYANRNTIFFAKKIAIPISFLNKILTPISVPMRNGIIFIERMLNVQKVNFSIDQLSQALELTSQSETSDGEQKILEGIVTFGNTEVRQVMSPRIDVFALKIDELFDEIMPKIIEKGYSRIPIFKENIDHIEGVLFVKDLIPYIDCKNFDWSKLIREPFFVPENKKLDDLLKDFQGMKSHLAIVVDEYGGTSGIISLEDVLEEIVGDISDEFDNEDVIYSKIDNSNFIFEGKIGLKDFCRIIEVDEAEMDSKKGEAETLAGFILEISGNFPKKKQKITFNNLIFTIENIDKRRIKQIKVTLMQ